MRFIDRSRILEWTRCPRSRWLGSHFNGHGITSGTLRVPLVTGGSIHLGLEQLSKGATADVAAAAAVDNYRSQADAALRAAGTALDHFDYTVEEQASLTEALVRVYALKGYPALTAEWEVLEVESEYEWDLAPGLRMMSRLDGLLRRRSDGELGVLSFKTDKGSYLEDKLPAGRIDLQGLTEPLAVLHSKWGIAPQWVKMEWLIKGAWKEEVKGSGQHFQDSFLVRPWRNAANGAIRWQRFWPCPGEPHEVMGANGKPWKCKGNVKQHGLGDGWERVPIWQHMPIKEWIGLLAEEPGALEACLFLPPAIPRSLAEMYSAQRIIASQELDIDRRLANLAAHNGPEGPMLEALDVNFPPTGKWNDQCHHSFGGLCQFITLCHSADQGAALIQWKENGFVPRQPHHLPELEAISHE